jgi:hypothetical protein
MMSFKLRDIKSKVREYVCTGVIPPTQTFDERPDFVSHARNRVGSFGRGSANLEA